jgi:hypothetical protein
MNLFSSLVWKRPEEFFGGQPFYVFDKDIDPKDIQQGGLGDCYFLSAISAIAENPERIRKIFLTRDVQKSGCYCVALCINGVWEEVIIDDLIPCRDFGGKIFRPAFNHSDSNELWVMLLEKAFAKVNGGYWNISGGQAAEALKALTGAPTKNFKNSELGKSKNPLDHWVNIIDGEDKNFIMMTSTKHKGLDELGTYGEDSRTGLARGHAYTLISAYEIYQDNSGKYNLIDKNMRAKMRAGHSSVDFLKGTKITRLLKLRNPWGRAEWKGQFSDLSSQWQVFPELKNILSHNVSANDGVFFIPFEAWMTYYNDYDICHYYDKYIYSSQRFQKRVQKSGGVYSNYSSYIKFRVTEQGNYFLGISQATERNFTSRGNDLFLFKTKNEKIRFQIFSFGACSRKKINNRTGIQICGNDLL